MGATVTTGKLAAAFRAPAGQIIYVLFEETYEKNCFPHTPHWGCICLGDLATVLGRIFSHAAACEGGSLQGRSGHLTPEGYIRGWLKALAAPVAFPDRQIRLKGGSGYYDTISPEKVERVKGVLVEMGRTDLLEKIVDGETLTVNLYQEIDVIAALCGKARVSAWQIIDGCSVPSSETRSDLGYAPRPSRMFDVPVPNVLRVDGENRLLQRPDGSWYCAGWAYSIVSSFVVSLSEAEITEPGSFAKRIKAYREAIETAPMVPLETIKVAVDTSVPLGDSYAQRSVAEFSAKHPVTATDTGFEVQPVPELMYKLTNLPTDCTSWIVPLAAESAQLVQMSLM